MKIDLRKCGLGWIAFRSLLSATRACSKHLCLFLFSTNKRKIKIKCSFVLLHSAASIKRYAVIIIWKRLYNITVQLGVRVRTEYDNKLRLLPWWWCCARVFCLLAHHQNSKLLRRKEDDGWRKRQKDGVPSAAVV